MAELSKSEIIPAFNARLCAQQFTALGDNAFQAACATSINAAVAAGAFTSTVSTTNYPSLVIQDKIGLLASLGYTVSYSGTTITLTW